LGLGHLREVYDHQPVADVRVGHEYVTPIGNHQSDPRFLSFARISLLYHVHKFEQRLRERLDHEDSLRLMHVPLQHMVHKDEHEHARRNPRIQLSRFYAQQ
jgi:hypothetical protein